MIADLRAVGVWLPRVWRDGPVWLVFILVSSVVAAFLQTAFPWSWQFAIDALQGDDAVSPGTVAVWTGAFGLGHAGLYVALQYARSVRNAAISATLRARLVRAVAGADPSARRAWRTGDLVARMHDDAGEKLSWFLCSGVFRAYEAALVAVAVLLAMAWTAPELVVWVVAPLPLLVVAQVASQGVTSRRQQEVQSAISLTTEVVESTFSTLRVVKAAGLLPLVHRSFRRHADEQCWAEIRASVVLGAVGLVSQFGWQFALVGLLWFGGEAVIDGSLSLGRYVTFEGLLASLIWPMFDLGNLAARIAPTAVSLRRLDEVLELPPAPAGTEVATPGPLEVRGLQVDDGEQVLVREVSFTVPLGARIGVAGALGAGKTVLLEAVAGLRVPAAGTVTLAGRPLAGLARDPAPVALVPQDPVPLATSIRDNVTLGRAATSGDLDEALRISQLASDLPLFAEGLDTEVGERGVSLSGGQRQRLAIARALVGRPLVLVLDDATSALDAEVEAAFWEALAPLRLSVLVVTHRPAALAACAEVVFLEGGRVADRGPHRELLARNPSYARIYDGGAGGG